MQHGLKRGRLIGLNRCPTIRFLTNLTPKPQQHKQQNQNPNQKTRSTNKSMEKSVVESNWSENVEDLIDSGESEKAINVLESVISELETKTDSNPELVCALTDLANLYSSKGFSLKSDQLHDKASLIKHTSRHVLASARDLDAADKPCVSVDASTSNASIFNVPVDEDDDDWETVADKLPDLVVTPQCLPKVSQLSLEDANVKAPKRRGRGTFSYKKDELYCDQTSDQSILNRSHDVPTSNDSRGSTELQYSSRYGTRHVLVLADFSPSTRTTDLEKLFDDFKSQGFVIQWVNDTVALAVFRTPSIALEASKSIKCPFTVRVLDEDDAIMSLISKKDLEPPRQRPQTSAKTANRLIAQGMGIKLPSISSSSKEFQKQEEDRRNRIISRQTLRDDAWGD